MTRADALTPAQINRVLKTCKIMPHSEGNAVLWRFLTLPCARFIKMRHTLSILPLWP